MLGAKFAFLVHHSRGLET